MVGVPLAEQRHMKVRSLLVALLCVAPVAAVDNDRAGLTPGSLPDNWLTGGPDCVSVPDWQIHAYNEDFYILRHHVFPQVLPLMLANTVLTVSLAILSESTLAFIGLGDPTVISWGQMMNFACNRGAVSAGA